MSLPRRVPSPRTPLDKALEGLRCRPQSVAVWVSLAGALQGASRLPESMVALDQALRLLAEFDDATTPEGLPDEEEVRRQRAFLAVTLGRERVESLLQGQQAFQEIIETLRDEAVCRFLDRMFNQPAPAARNSSPCQKQADDRRARAMSLVFDAPRKALALGLEAHRLHPAAGHEFLLYLANRLIDTGRTPEAVGLLDGLAQVTLDRRVLIAVLRTCREPGLPAQVLEARKRALDALTALYPSDPELVAERALAAALEGRSEEALRLRDWILSHPEGLDSGLELDAQMYAVLHCHGENLLRSTLAVREAGRRGVATEQALRWYRDALELNPSELRALAAIVDSYLAAAAHDKAVDVSREALSRLPDSVAASTCLFRALAESCREKEALEVALFQLGRWPSRWAWARVAEASRLAERPDWVRAARAMAEGHAVIPESGSDEAAEEIFRQARDIRTRDLAAVTGD